ncbi:MAG: L,D-transpeptidase [Pyrinomonadaceae bacterium]
MRIKYGRVDVHSSVLDYRFRSSLVLLVLLAALGLSGCDTTPQGGPPQNASPATSATPAADTADQKAAAGAPADLTITLPLLGAMLADDEFAAELKQQVGLSDEQIARLRQVSDEAVSGLDEKTDDGAAAGSTRASVEHALNEIRKIAGDEKANTVLGLIRRRYEAGGEIAAMKPNTVPTDTRIVVNAPAYRMDVFKDGRLVKTYKIAIGYPEFPLPTGVRKAQTIIFNPTWTPPDEPWVKGKVRPGKKVEAGDKLNPLGPVKIPIGLPSLIHGGKQPAKLGGFGSHGCVGLTDSQAIDFSRTLADLAGQPISEPQLKELRADRTETKQVKLDNAMPVELRYETIVLQDGQLHIYRDVYERGTNTVENLERVLAVYGLALSDLAPDVRARIDAALKAMAYDAGGNPVEPRDAGNKGKANSNGKVTRAVKGEKEMIVAIPQLAGRGYPPPAALSER